MRLAFSRLCRATSGSIPFHFGGDSCYEALSPSIFQNCLLSKQGHLHFKEDSSKKPSGIFLLVIILGDFSAFVKKNAFSSQALQFIDLLIFNSTYSHSNLATHTSGPVRNHNISYDEFASHHF